MDTNSNSFMKSIAAQVAAIVIAALGAAAITFLQSIAAQTGACPVPAADPTQAGVLGAAFKTAHSMLTSHRGIL